jgi:hypothetical protein
MFSCAVVKTDQIINLTDAHGPLISEDSALMEPIIISPSLVSSTAVKKRKEQQY